MSVYQETKIHGTPSFPYAVYWGLVPDWVSGFPLHWHEEMEITLICEGTSDYRVGQEPFRAAEGDIILIPPYCTHSAYEIPGRTMVSDSLVFHLDLLGAQGQDLSASKYLRPLAEGRLQMPEVIRGSDRGYREIKEAFLGALECFQNRPPFYEMRLRENLLHVIILLFEFGYIREPSEGHSTFINRLQLRNVLQYIAEHYREKIRVADLAGLSGFSESYFMSFFKQHVGISCIQYINHYRVQKAAHALEETSQPVMEIAMDHGFDNISYFNLQFRKEFGMTPREFRSQHRRGA